MASKLTLEYDRVGDILYISNCRPYPEQESEELGDGIIARLNPVTSAEPIGLSELLSTGDAFVFVAEAKGIAV